MALRFVEQALALVVQLLLLSALVPQRVGLVLQSLAQLAVLVALRLEGLVHGGGLALAVGLALLDRARHLSPQGGRVGRAAPLHAL
ncbi:hypothetical protein IWX47DRAFT_874975 [Phyllosticta citricarpa]